MSAILAAFINAGIAGAAVTMAIWLALSIAPRRMLNAATRYAVWWIALIVVVTLPVFFLPHRADPVSPFQPVATVETQIPAPAEAQPVPSPSDAPLEAPQSRWPRFPMELSAGAWPNRIFTFWGFIALCMLLRLCASYMVLEQRKRRARTEEKLQRWPVRALVSPDIASPMAAGLFRPAILLPEHLLAELDDDELDQIRVHETAHLVRRDDIALLIERSIEALFALHPVVRWITRQIDLEREIACDDFVVEQTGKARPYASCLTRVVEFAGGVRPSKISATVAAAATEEHSHLARRIEMLLDKTRHKGTRLLKLPLLFILLAVVLLTYAAVRTPGIVAFAAAQESFSDQIPVPPEPPLPPVPPEPPAAPEAPVPPAPPVPPEAPAPPAPPPPPESPEPPVPPLPPAPPEPPQASWTERSNHTTTWRTTDGLHIREIRIHGDVHFNDDETDVKSMSADGFFSYEESYGFTGRRYQAMMDSSGQIVRRYMVDGREKPVDGDAQAWLRAILPDLLRDSGIDAPERVRRILKKGGAPAVLAEIAKIHSDGTKYSYIRELVPIGNLNTDQFQSLLRVVRGMGSDGEKAAVLSFLSPYTLKDGLRDYTFEAVKTINSDGEKHRVLTKFIQQDSSRATLIDAARAAVNINSDGEKAAVLVDLAPRLRGNTDLPHPFFRAAETINSDGERARVLMAVIASAGEQHDTLAEALRVARSMNSDGEKALVLVHADAYWKDDDLVRQAYFDTTRSIQSDGEKARVLTSLIGRGGLSDHTLIDLIHCAAGINSDGEKARVLVAVANHSTGKSNVRDEIKIAAKSIHSDGEYRRVMAAIDLRALNIPNGAQAR